MTMHEFATFKSIYNEYIHVKISSIQAYYITPHTYKIAPKEPGRGTEMDEVYILYIYVSGGDKIAIYYKDKQEAFRQVLKEVFNESI